MKAHDISKTNVFSTWLLEEKAYLQSLKQEPLEETMQIEYYQRLVTLSEYE